MKSSWGWFWVIIGLLMVFLAACGRPSEKPKKAVVGIVNVTPILEDTVVSLKKGLSKLGYQENDNIRYLYQGPWEAWIRWKGPSKRFLPGNPI